MAKQHPSTPSIHLSYLFPFSCEYIKQDRHIEFAQYILKCQINCFTHAAEHELVVGIRATGVTRFTYAYAVLYAVYVRWGIKFNIVGAVAFVAAAHDP